MQRYNEERAVNFSFFASAFTGHEFKAADFMPVSDSEETPDRMFEKLKVLNILMGGTVEGKNYGQSG